MINEMKEVEGSEHSGAAVKTKSSSGCLIVEKKAAYLGGVLGFSDSPSKKLLNLNKERKRPRVVLSDSESTDDELAEPVGRKVYKLDTGLVEHENFRIEKRVNNESDQMKIEDNELNLGLSVSNEDDKEDFDDLQLKTGVLKATLEKHKSTGVSSKDNSPVKVVKRKINTRTKNVTTVVKGKESKMKRASGTEKQLLREKIKKMLFDAGWKIDYRKRRNRDYLDSVYISPSGTGYWSITKAYEALQKVEKNKSKATGEFTPLPNEILNKLTRQTRKKIEREIEKSKTNEGSNSKKSKQTRVKKSAPNAASKLSESRLTEANLESDDHSSDNSGKKSPLKDRLKKSTIRTSPHIVNKSGNIGRLTLMGRGSDKDQDSEENGVVFYSGKRTLISWLIDSKVVSVGEKVNYMNLRKTRVMQEGWITEDGIQCDCCSKIVTILRFELHAGSKLGQPFENIYLEKSGNSLLQCVIDGWNKEKELEKKGFCRVNADCDDPNDDTCGLCGDGGDLICCDGCPSTFHLNCLDLQMLPQGDWHCPNCACKYCEKVSKKGRSDNSLVTCHLCEKKYHKSCSPDMDVDTNGTNFPFCGHKCREVYKRLQKLLWKKHELDSGYSWSLIHRSDSLPNISSKSVEFNLKLAVARLVMDECFLPIVDRRSGITIIHNVVYNCGSNFSRLNYSGFFTAILEKGDEMIAAASIRIHGSQLAEMPFIGTRHLYRRQGMCRRLLQAIESALLSLKVEKLVIPAIEEHVQTWTSAFGFSPLEKSHKQEMRSFNMLVFPGTDMLKISLMKKVNRKGNINSEKGLPLIGKKLDLNVDYSPEVEIQSSAKKSDTHAVNGMIPDGNESAERSVTVAAAIDLQNGNETALGIGMTDSGLLESQVSNGASHDTVSINVPCGPQLLLTARDSVSVNTHSDSIPLEPNLQILGMESVEKENDAHDVTNRNL